MNILSIAGSDPSAGAGIQGDIKTFTALGVYGLTVITTLTSQNTSKFIKANPISSSIVKNQIDSILSDFKIDAIKIGMVYDKKIINTIYSQLKNLDIPIVLDPIFESTTGGMLIKPDALNHFRKLLMPISYIITPNVPEAEKISNLRIRSLADLKNAALKIESMGSKNVIIKGGHLGGQKVMDLLLENKKFHVFSQKRIKLGSHGSGCVFSAALCVAIGRGRPIVDAIKFARQITLESIMNSKTIGKGLAIARQNKKDPLEDKLTQAINELKNLKMIYRYIPECQTNFVFSKSRPSSIYDILGLEGRIVKTGNSVSVAGSLKYGGSKHVGSAVLEVTRRFPETRSALNIRYDDKIIEKAERQRFHISHYDRMTEPKLVKTKEGSSISWGIRSAIKREHSAPDLIYHKGDHGKEPMILIFGKNPSEVLSKLERIYV